MSDTCLSVYLFIVVLVGLLLDVISQMRHVSWLVMLMLATWLHPEGYTGSGKFLLLNKITMHWSCNSLEKG